MSSNKQMKSSGISDADNEMAGRLLLMGVVGVIALVVLAVSPVLLGGFLIGLIWYGAYMEDGEPNGEKLFWPIVTTLALFVYGLGIMPPWERFFQGVLFTDFHAWTGKQITAVLVMVNEWMPRGHQIHSVALRTVRFYGWSVFLMAVATLVWLHFKGAGRGVFIYHSARAIFAPVRLAASRWQWLAVLVIGIGALSLMVTLPAWFKIGVGITLGLMMLYHVMAVGITFGGADQAAANTERRPQNEPVLIGSEKGKPNKRIQLTDDQLNHHVHIVGASGFGKSVLLSHVIKNRIHSGGGVLFVDLKADFETIRQVVSTVKGAGRENDLRIFSCGNPEISHPYNAIKCGTANQLRDRIMGALNWSEEFYKHEAASYLLKILRGLTLLRDRLGKPFDLGTILNCITDQNQITRVIDDLPETETQVREELEGLHRHLAKPENLKALQGLKSQLESLLLSDFGHLLRAHDGGIDLFEAIQQQKIVYLLLDSRTYGESSRALGKIILQDLKAASARVDNEIPRAERKPFAVIVDEFADMATEDFVGFLDRARSSKIGVVVAHQEIADLSRISPEFARRLMNSTSTLFAFLQKLPDSSELIAGVAGTRKTREVTEQAETDWLFGERKTGMKSIKEVDEFVIHPNVIRSLNVGECVMVQKYPSSKSAVVRVKQEAVDDYLTYEEVQDTLQAMRGRYTLRDESKMVTRRPAPLRGAEIQEPSSYWQNGI
ncbi:MAG TPA: type IV secretory system conjugative DNA transfer family protein [Bdellovibrionales bacterium]|nr:type IV secretory system conjugative DNA transfer family protein [Bdellovibrionales bacterium]